MGKIGKNIKKIRNVRGLSQQAFGELFDLTRGNISSYEELRAEPRIETLLMIAKYFSISLEDFIEKDLSVNELLNYNTDIVLETEKLKRSSQLRDVPYISGLDFAEYLSNYDNEEYIYTLPHLVVPSSSKLDLLAVEVDNVEAFPVGYNYKVGDILIFERVTKENIHRVEDKLGLQIDADGAKIGIYNRDNDEIFLVLNEWVKYSFDMNSKSVSWILRASYAKAV